MNPGLVPGFCFDSPEILLCYMQNFVWKPVKSRAGPTLYGKGMLLLLRCRQYGQFS
jgi:hypothetical protein